MRRTSPSAWIIPLLCALLIANATAFGRWPDTLNRSAALSPDQICLAAFSQTAGTERTTSLAAEYERLRKEGFELVYDLDYSGARQRFQRMTELDSELPAGFVYLAMNRWLEILNQRRRLQLGLYTGTSFFSAPQSPVDSASEQELMGNVEKAIDASSRLLAKEPNRADALYYQGAAYAVRAGFDATVRRSFFSALGDGSQAASLHRKVLKIDPNYKDALLSIGMYDYIAGSLPLPIRLLAAIGGVRGSKSRGIQELETAAREGKYAAEDAQVLLVALYAREGRNDDSLRLLASLAERHPKNYLLQVELAATLSRLGRDAESRALFESMLKNAALNSALDLIHYQYGESLFGKDDFEHAILQFRYVLSLGGAEEGMVTLAHLRTGQCYDALGNHRSALGHYHAVLKRPSVYDSREQATRYARTPFRAPRNGK